MQVNFKVYPRKIDVYVLSKSLDEYTNKINGEYCTYFGYPDLSVFLF